MNGKIVADELRNLYGSIYPGQNVANIFSDGNAGMALLAQAIEQHGKDVKDGLHHLSISLSELAQALPKQIQVKTKD